jgi:hypothetical protein
LLHKISSTLFAMFLMIERVKSRWYEVWIISIKTIHTPKVLPLVLYSFIIEMEWNY